jgi:hypothetical protein
MILNFRRDKIRQWKRLNEKYAKICVRRRWKEISEFMFWDCFSYDKKNSCHVWKAEIAVEKRAAQREIDQMNERLKLLIKQQWKLETKIKRMKLRNSDDRKSIWKWDERHEKIVRKEKDDIDWYRYQEMSFFIQMRRIKCERLFHSTAKDYFIQLRRVISFNCEGLFYSTAGDYFIQMRRVISFKCERLFHSTAKSYFIQLRRVISFKCEGLFHSTAGGYFIQMSRVISFNCEGLFHSTAGGYFIQLRRVISFNCEGLFHSTAGGYFIQLRGVISFNCGRLFHSNTEDYFIQMREINDHIQIILLSKLLLRRAMITKYSSKNIDDWEFDFY